MDERQLGAPGRPVLNVTAPCPVARHIAKIALGCLAA
jgi:hypothetical protein